MKVDSLQELAEMQDRVAQLTSQWKFVEAMPMIREGLVSMQAIEKSTAWWDLWLNFQRHYCYSLYAIGGYDELKENIQFVKPFFDKYGTVFQKLNFLHTVQLDLLRRHRWFNVPEEAVVVAETIVQLAEGLQDTYQMIWGYSMLAYTYLWRHDPVASRVETMKALELLKNFPEHKFGYSFALPNLIHSYRIERDVPNTEYYARNGIQLSREKDIEGLEALCKVGLCWVMLKRGSFAESEILAQEAFETLIRTSAPYLYVALFPLISLNLKKGELGKATDYVFLLLHPNLQELPKEISKQLDLALRARSKKDMSTLRFHLENVVELADNTGYL